MDEFIYTIPPQQARGKTAFSTKEKVLVWADNLPLTDNNALSSLLTTVLKEINQSNLDYMNRFEVVEVMRSLSRVANENLEKSYLYAVLPMASRSRSGFESACSILKEMASAYLILVEDVIKSGHKAGIARMLPYALYHATSYLARLLVSHYVVYAPEPKGIWIELHRLYWLAKEHKIDTLTLNITRKRGDIRERSIAKAYKRVLLLAQAGPYNLMQGEVNSIYNLMEMWSIECALLPVQGNETLQQVLVVDSELDTGPRYLSRDGRVPTPKRGWIFKCDGVQQIMNKKIREFLSPATGSDKTKHTLGARLERDMYFRLSDAWTTRHERMHERAATKSEEREVVVGLSAYHFIVSDGAGFAPERVELLINKKEVFEGNSTVLELVLGDEQPWRKEKEMAEVEAGVHPIRLADFKQEKEVWGNVQVKQARHLAMLRDQQAETAKTSYQVKVCLQLDKSQGGVKLFARMDAGIQLKVGELVGLRYPRPGEKDQWRLTSVRWIKTQGTDALSFGVKFISDEVKPMAARGMKGAGEGGAYIRVLIVSELVQNRRELSLVVPAAVYDLNTEVLINNGKDLRTIRLTSLIETTNTFSRFRFEVMAIEGGK